MAEDFFVRFWGVRGSIAASSPATMRYGGNTSCLEIRCNGHLMMFDCGTGGRLLGNTLCDAAPLDFDIFLSHTHLDHIVGLPFFGPFYDARNRCRIHAGNLLPERKLQDVLAEMMKAPLFPVSPDVFRADIQYLDFRPGDVMRPCAGVTVRTGLLNHPDRAVGYRVESNGRSICYVSDTEHRDGEVDDGIASLIAGADIVIYDAMYTDEEYDCHRGWGHSTWRAGVALCAAAKAKTLVLFHHEPGHDDNFMDGLAREAAAARPGTLVAREGMLLRP